jgi:hypothetical protein
MKISNSCSPAAAIKKINISNILSENAPAFRFDASTQTLDSPLASADWHSDSPCQQLARYLCGAQQKAQGDMVSHTYSYQLTNSIVECTHVSPLAITRLSAGNDSTSVAGEELPGTTYFQGEITIENDTISGKNPFGGQASFRLPS